MVNLLTRIGAAVVCGVTARVLDGARMGGILERGLLTGDVGGLLAHRGPVAGLATAANGEARRLTTVHSGRGITLTTGLWLGRRAVEHGRLRRAVPAGLLTERAGLPAVPALTENLLLVLLRGAEPRPATERAGLPAVPALTENLLLVLLRGAEAAGLLTERAGLPAVPALTENLLLVLLRGTVPGPAR